MVQSALVLFPREAIHPSPTGSSRNTIDRHAGHHLDSSLLRFLLLPFPFLTMSTHHAWVEITGKVFVEAQEIENRLKEKYPDLLTREDIEEDDIAYLDRCSVDQEKECFEEIAKEKISALFPTDDPVKWNETIINMTTYC